MIMNVFEVIRWYSAVHILIYKKVRTGVKKYVTKYAD